MKLRVVLVEPKYEGNIGSIARLMKNLGFNELVLVNPCEIDCFGLAMAAHARDCLESARTVSTLREAVFGASLIVGSTGVRGLNTDEHLRVPALSPKDLASRLFGKDGLVALLFGREDNGLSKEEIRSCDMVVSVPTDKEYPIMNVSHAAAIILYELSHVDAGDIRLASRANLDRFYEHARDLLDEINYPSHKLEKTMLMLRRIFGRAELTDREVQTMRGILRSIQWRIGESGSVEVSES
jgi:TrmH family RNA methyltransferase